MSLSELLLTAIVALIVFGPKKLPMLAHHLGRLMVKYNHYRQTVLLFWQQQRLSHQLEDNIRKAEQADRRHIIDKKI